MTTTSLPLGWPVGLPCLLLVIALSSPGCSAGDGDSGSRDRSGASTGLPGGGGAGTGQPGAGDPGGFGNSTAVPTAGSGAAPISDPIPVAPGDECAAVTQMAENTYQPADIIFGVDTSGSMAEEVLQVQTSLNAFSQQIIDSGIDARVIMLATLQDGSSLASGGQAVEGPCVGAPLGSGQCPNDSNPPAYVHVNTPVTSWDVLDVYVHAYPMYKEHLREDSLKTFVTISDDNANGTNHPFAALAPIYGVPIPVIDDADTFIAAVNDLEPGSTMWADWHYSGIFSFSLCPSAATGAVGVVHQDLVDATGGVAGDLCLQQFAPVFDELARQVVASATLACDWEIPTPPDGEAFDPSRSNVQLTLDGVGEVLLKVPDLSQCGADDGWHYDDEDAPTEVLACPTTCERIQGAAAAQVDLQFGCETRLRPPE